MLVYQSVDFYNPTNCERIEEHPIPSFLGHSLGKPCLFWGQSAGYVSSFPRAEGWSVETTTMASGTKINSPK